MLPLDKNDRGRHAELDGLSPVSTLEPLVVFVPINTVADVILPTIQPILLRLGEMAIVRGHIFLLGVLQPGFPVLETAGFFRA